jgi:hypothetical protein
VFSGLFRLKDWYIMLPLGAAALALGVWGFASCHQTGASVGVLGWVGVLGEAMAKTIGLIFLRGLGGDKCIDTRPQLAIAQFMLPAIALVGGAKLFLVNLRRDMRVALAQRARDHVIVCGLGDTGRTVVESLSDAGRTVVAITLDLNDPNAFACERLGVAVLTADAAQPSILRHAGVEHASAIVTTTGSDAKNLEIGLRAAEALAGRQRTPIKVLAEMRSGWLMDRLLSHRTAVLSSPGVDFQIINLQVNAARALLRSPAFERTFGGAPARSSPHIVVAGFGEVATEFIRRAICSNFALEGVQARITVFDEHAAQTEASLRLQAPGVLELAKFTFESRHFGADDVATTAGIEALLSAGEVNAVLVARDEDEDALHTAFHFRTALDNHDRLAVPVFVRLKEQHKLGGFLRQVESHPLLPDRLSPFGDLRDLTAPGMLLDGALDRTARAVQEVYLAHQKPGATSPANVPWERLPEIFKSSNRDVADHIAAELRSAGYRLAPAGAAAAVDLDENAIETLARAEHWRWLLERRAAGWMFAEERNDALKRTPALKDWDDIDEPTRDFDRAFARQIVQIVAKTGQCVTREQMLVLGASPQDDIDRIEPDTLAVIVVDPPVDAHWTAAHRAVAETGARLRLRWRGARALSQIERRQDLAALLPAFEGWVFP